MQVFSDSGAGRENSLPAPARLLGCRDVTGDTGKGRNTYGEGLPRSCYMRPLTHLDSEPSRLITVSKSTLCAFMECLSGKTPPLVHGALSFHSEVCGAAAQGRDEGLH